MPTPSLIIPSAPVYDEGNLYGLNVYGTQFAPEAIPFTRATTATRTNAAGLIELVPYNLLVQSNTFNIGWAMFTGPAVTPNSTTSPDGLTNATTLNSSGGSNDFLYQTLSGLTIGAIYSFSFYIKNLNSNNSAAWGTAQTGSIAYLNWSGSTLLSVSGSGNSFTSVGNGWYRVLLTGAAVSATPSMRIYADSNNTSKSVYIYGAQLVEGTAALPYLKTETRLNRPRVDFSLGGCPNLLLEPQRTNLALQSASFDDASWFKNAASITVNSTTSPSGIVDADTLVGDGTTAFHGISQNASVVSGTTYTISIYAKKNTNNFIQLIGGVITFGSNVWANFNLDTGVVGSVGSSTTASIQSVGNGWYRCVITGAAISTTTNAAPFYSLVTSSTSARAESNTLNTSVFLWGAQLEAGAYATSYIPTLSTSVTRNADSFTDSNIFSRGMITAAGGTWFMELRNNIISQRDVFSASLGLVNNIATLTDGFVFAKDGSVVYGMVLRKRIAGVETSLLNTAAGNVKLAIKWNGSTADIFQNGVKVVNATAFTPTALEFLFGNGNDVPKYIQQMALYPTPLSDNELEEMTGEGFNTYAAMASYYNYITQ